jgi:hypothetical protein
VRQHSGVTFAHAFHCPWHTTIGLHERDELADRAIVLFGDELDIDVELRDRLVPSRRPGGLRYGLRRNVAVRPAEQDRCSRRCL